MIAMQMMEFEMEHDMRRDDELADDFNNKEFRGSSCKSQLLTVSTFLVIVQIAILWAISKIDLVNRILHLRLSCQVNFWL